jgi:calcineurin-like phosphoesterase family protein
MPKPLRQYKNLSRVPVANYARSAFARTGRYNPLAIFERGAILNWFSGAWRFSVDHRWTFQSANAAPNGTSLYTVPDSLRINMTGDWGTGSEEAQMVAEQMARWDQASHAQNSDPPDFTIHLGDIYYVGDGREVEENCLGGYGAKATRQPNDCVTWRHGRLGSFALQGNHEMYANGIAYFTEFLPTLGMIGANGKPQGQGASFFCLENRNWRIVGIDTGYNSVTKRRILRLINHGDCSLEDALLDWLRNVVRPGSSPKATVILSHQQYFSAFEKEEYPLPARQLEEFFDSPVIWFWAHEHRCAGYSRYGSAKLKAYGRCIGHGGMPIEFTEMRKNDAAQALLFHDGRRNPLYADDNLGYNGFAQLEFTGRDLTVRYQSLAMARAPSKRIYQDSPDLLRTETFRWDGRDFTLTNVINHQTSEGFFAKN